MTLAQAKSKAEAAFGAWKKSGATIDPMRSPAANSGPSISLVARPGSVQTSLRVGTQSIERTDPDYDALTVANRVLGGGPIGRLFEHLREAEGLHLRRQQQLQRDPCRRTVDRINGRALGGHRSGADRSDGRDPPDARHAGAGEGTRRHQEGARRRLRAVAREPERDPAATTSDRYIYKLPADYWDTYPARIDAITAADVQRVAKKYWAPGQLQIVAVGDASKVEPALKKLGAVQSFDAEGKPIK